MRFGRAVGIAALLVAFSFLARGEAQEPDADARAAVRMVIERQLDAFRRDDAVDAFSYAAPSIRELFETSDRFLDMVRRGYAPLYRSERPIFVRGRLMEPGVFLQEVAFTGPNGKGWSALYTLERQSDGEWRISGCVLKPAPGKSI
jgi:hypothetical protein